MVVAGTGHIGGYPHLGGVVEHQPAALGFEAETAPGVHVHNSGYAEQLLLAILHLIAGGHGARGDREAASSPEGATCADAARVMPRTIVSRTAMKTAAGQAHNQLLAATAANWLELFMFPLPEPVAYWVT